MEQAFGMFNDPGADFESQRMMIKMYNQRQSAVKSGINTDWIPKPLRLGVGNKHSLSVELGDKALQAIVDLSYQNIKGVMKGSDRTNIARILNELNGSFSGRNDIVDKLCRYPLLIIDDFGMERGTEYALEQIYNIVDSRYRSQKPLIVTTNLTLDEIRHPQDTAHARIYDRLLEMCVPISCIGMSFRQETAQEKLERLKELIGYEGTLKLYEKEEQLAQKFASFFPEQTSEQDRVAAFLSQDVTAIRQDYIQTFSPPPVPRKKKRSRRE